MARGRGRPREAPAEHAERDPPAAAGDAGEADPLENLEDFNVIMVVSCSGGSLGVAVYEHATAAVSCFQSQEDGKGPFAYNLLQLLKVQTSPSIIYTSSKTEAALLEALRQPALGGPAGNNPGEGEGQQGIPVRLERAAAFHHDKAIKRLESLHVAGHPPCLNPRAHLALLNTMVDLTREQQVCALGALVVVLQKAHALSHSGGDVGTDVMINTLTELSLQACLVVDPASLSALSIIQEERHASLMGLGKPKEGFSLFGLLNRCVTPMGRRLLRSWFMRPIVNPSVLNDRLDAVQLLVGAPDVCKELQDQLKKVADVPRLLQRLQQVQSKPDPRCFIALQDSLLQLLSLREVVGGLVAREEALEAGDGEGLQRAGGAGAGVAVGQGPCWRNVTITLQVLEHINEHLSAAHALLSHVIDPDQKEEGMLVAGGVCEELDDMKDTYQGLPDLLTRVLEAELERVPAQLARLHLHDRQLWSISYLPQVGYAIQVTSHELPDELLEVLPDYHQEFEVDSAEGRCVFYSTDSTRELSKRFGDMLYKIQDLEASLCVELVGRLQEHAPAMTHAASVAATLDCLVSFALVSAQLNYARPILTQDNVLDIKGGRHPLAEVAVSPAGSAYIPNDTHMEADKARVHVVTGPNASGKSCYAKQVALIVYMAHLGCFVPADSAVVGVADRILTRLVSCEQVAAHASSFSQDLTQVSRMVNQATGRSILIIDEFGKGTLSADGVGLMSALLSEFCTRADEAPRVVACTHFHELMDPKVLPRHPMLAFFTMEVLTGGEPAGAAHAAGAPVRPAQPSSELVFLHRLVPGYESPSFGIHCAQLCGVRADVVARAWQVLAAHQAKTRVTPLASALRARCCDTYEGWVRELVGLNLCSAAAAAGAGDGRADGGREGGDGGVAGGAGGVAGGAGGRDRGQAIGMEGGSAGLGGAAGAAGSGQQGAEGAAIQQGDGTMEEGTGEDLPVREADMQTAAGFLVRVGLESCKLHDPQGV